MCVENSRKLMQTVSECASVVTGSRWRCAHWLRQLGKETKGSMNERERKINRNFLLKEIDFKVCSCCCIHLSTYNFDLPF